MFDFLKPKSKIEKIIESTNEIVKKLKKETRTFDRDIFKYKKEEQRIIKECKKHALNGDKYKIIKTFIKELIRTRKTIDRMYTTNAQLNSAISLLKLSIATIKFQKCVHKSTLVLSCMNKLVRHSEINSTMMELSRELIKMELIDEIISDGIDTINDIDETDDQINKVMTEIFGEVTLVEDDILYDVDLSDNNEKSIIESIPIIDNVHLSQYTNKENVNKKIEDIA